MSKSILKFYSFLYISPAFFWEYFSNFYPYVGQYKLLANIGNNIFFPLSVKIWFTVEKHEPGSILKPLGTSLQVIEIITTIAPKLKSAN